MAFENRSGVFVVRYGKPEELSPEAQRDLEAAVRGSAQAVGIVFVVAPAVQAVAHEVPEYWLGITSDKRVRIAAIAVVTPNPAVSVATRGFSTSNILKECLGRWSSGYDAVDLQTLAHSLRFRPAKGMVRGFMDMVFEHGGRFYLIDWKSNHLGYRVEAYGREALKSAMDQKLYSLQYLLYTVALNRYLSLRVRDYQYSTHFGGVLYLFLRGMDRERGEESGVFRDTPPAEMIHELTDCLIQAGG